MFSLIEQKGTEDFKHISKKTNCIHKRINLAGLFGIDCLNWDKLYLKAFVMRGNNRF